MEKPYKVIEVSDSKQYKRLAELFREYESDLGFELSFQNFRDELDKLPQIYGPPYGKAYLLKEPQGTFFGCIAVRKLVEEVGEIKRMYLKPEWRGLGYGKVLLDIALEAAKDLGYKKVRLDTLDTMTAAIAIYKEAGFYEIPQYRENPFDNAVFMEKEMRGE
ncbi:MAG: GNAT family N-acetyltransferase [Bacteroidales bacterium]|nr:GNAT family N-acetyltransferase [Bacteroidales bacterium]MCF8337507.1 GNAT family N-acetyltransferase [Bacteroidales bacterium]